MSTTPSGEDAIDANPYYKKAADAARESIVQRQQVTIIEQAKCDWGGMYIRRIATDIDRKIDLANKFSLVISDKNSTVVGEFDIDASLLAKAFCEGSSALFYVLQHTPDALDEVAKLSLAVKSIMDALAIAQVTPTSKAQRQIRRPIL